MLEAKGHGKSIIALISQGSDFSLFTYKGKVLKLILLNVTP
jgi:hypothetical protein